MTELLVIFVAALALAFDWVGAATRFLSRIRRVD
jgi:hypothetical protein